MTPDEVLAQLKLLGVKISRPTLSRYEKQRLIPVPKRGSLGRGGGRWTDYPPETVAEAFAAWALLNGKYGFSFVNEQFFDNKPPVINPLTICIARGYALDTLRKYTSDVYDMDQEEQEIVNQLSNDYNIHEPEEAFLNFVWQSWEIERKRANLRLKMLK